MLESALVTDDSFLRMFVGRAFTCDLYPQADLLPRMLAQAQSVNHSRLVRKLVKDDRC